MSKVLDVPAVSSAAATTDRPTPSFEEQYKQWTPEQKTQFALTGNEPPAISSPVKKEETPVATPEGEAPKPEPEAGPEKDKLEPVNDHRSDRRSRRDARKIGELSAENRRLQRELATAKTGRSNEATVTDPPAKEGRPARPDEPDISEFDTIEQYRAARKQHATDIAKYEDDLLDWNQKRSESRRQQETEKSTAEERQRSTIEAFDKRAGDFQKTQKDYDGKQSPSYATAFTEVLESFNEEQVGPLVRNAVIESDMGPALVLHLGTNPEELDRICGLSVSRAIAEIGKIEATLAKAPKPKLVSGAPAPGSRVNANSQVTGDPIEDAYARGDFAAGAKLEAQRDAERSQRRR